MDAKDAVDPAEAARVWHDVMHFDAPRDENDVYTTFTRDHVFGRVWTRPGLGYRDRRLISLTAIAVAGMSDPLAVHLKAAYVSGDLSADELQEWIVHLAHYAGWPTAATAYAILRKVLAENAPA